MGNEREQLVDAVDGITELLESNNSAELLTHVAHSEGFESRAYQCPAGKLTIGYGTNIEVGLSKEEGLLLMAHRLNKSRNALQAQVPFFTDLPSEVQFVLTDMAYNLGVAGLLAFRNAFAAAERADWATMAQELMDSRWYRQTGNRSRALVAVIEGLI